MIVAYIVAAVSAVIALVACTITLSRFNRNQERVYGVRTYRATFRPFVRWRWIAIDRYDVPFLITLTIVVGVVVGMSMALYLPLLAAVAHR